MDEIGKRPEINLFDFIIEFVIEIEKLVSDLVSYGHLFLNLYEEIKIIEEKRVDCIKDFLANFIKTH